MTVSHSALEGLCVTAIISVRNGNSIVDRNSICIFGVEFLNS